MCIDLGGGKIAQMGSSTCIYLRGGMSACRGRGSQEYRVKLAHGEEVTFDMTAGRSKACFKTQRDRAVHSVTMNRSV
eukprot:6186778-Pleurochrysis_carterae.AAC.2